jgi:hypothetical protein
MAYYKRYSAKTRSIAARYRASLRKRVSTRKIYKPRYPARFRGGRKPVYAKTKKMSKSYTNFGETIYKPLNAQNEVTPSINPTGKTFTLAYCLGATVPSGWTGYNALGSMVVSQGAAAGERVGAYAYLKKTHMTISIDMKPNTSSASSEPCTFRVIKFIARPSMREFGTSYTPSTSLMYDTSGNEIGPDSSGITGADLMLQPLNRKRWICEQRTFTLSPPSGTSGSINSKYPSRKVLTFNCPFWKKCKFNAASEPQDVNTKYGLIVIATSHAKFQDADRWELNLRGTTTFNDC